MWTLLPGSTLQCGAGDRNGCSIEGCRVVSWQSLAECRVSLSRPLHVPVIKNRDDARSKIIDIINEYLCYYVIWYQFLAASALPSNGQAWHDSSGPPLLEQLCWPFGPPRPTDCIQGGRCFRKGNEERKVERKVARIGKWKILGPFGTILFNEVLTLMAPPILERHPWGRTVVCWAAAICSVRCNSCDCWV